MKSTLRSIPLCVAVLTFGIKLLPASTQAAVVIVPVADVWSRPLNLGEKPSDTLRETQILFGENVLIHESSGPWVRIEAIEQPEFTHHNKWEGYPGWAGAVAFSTTVPVSNAIVLDLGWAGTREKGWLPLGSKVELQRSIRPDDPYITWPHHPENMRSAIVQTAVSFQGTYYRWGGLTSIPEDDPFDPMVSGFGIDCSGLTYLSFRVNGIHIPRDSYEQWMKAKPIKRAELKPADLIFSAKADNPKTITHVALYAGGDQIIEAPQTGMVVRKISFKEKYGKPLEEVESGDKVGERVVYFGSFLH